MSAANKVKPSVQVAPPATVEEFAQNRRVLIVDDEKSIADGLSSLLAPKNSNVVPLKSSRGGAAVAANSPAVGKAFEVDVANNATEAIELFNKALAEGRPYAMGFF
jgi:DNA-binding NtrC family response regulator